MSMAASTEAPSLSALSRHLLSHSSPPGVDEDDYSLALQIQHNLQYQHAWTELLIVTHDLLDPHRPLPRALIAGRPPKRIYVHPDDQVEEVKRGVPLEEEEEEEEEADVEREWVLPTRLRERWSLRRFAEVFDGVGEETPATVGEEYGEERRGKTAYLNKGRRDVDQRRRGGKRVLLATLGEDSTVVYYIMHDGIVKPRQN